MVILELGLWSCLGLVAWAYVGYLLLLAILARARRRTLVRSDMRTRVIIRTIHALMRRASMLNPFRYGLFAFQLWSHKALRYLVPELLAGAFLASLALAVLPGPRASLYRTLVALQLGSYVGAAAVWWASRQFRLRARALSVPVYFLQVNAAAFWAVVSYLRGERKVTWTTAR